MDFGSPEFVLWIVGIVMAASVFKTAVRAKHGMSDFPGGGSKRARREELAALRDQSVGQLENLSGENRRLAEVETYYVSSNPRLSAEIERLR